MKFERPELIVISLETEAITLSDGDLTGGGQEGGGEGDF